MADAFTFFQNLRKAVVFREAPDAGFTVPAAADVPAVWTQTQTKLKNAILTRQETEATEGAAMVARAETAYVHSRTETLIFMGVALVIAVALAVFVRGVIVRQLGSVAKSLAAVARGDLTVPAEVQTRDELGGMAVAVPPRWRNRPPRPAR